MSTIKFLSNLQFGNEIISNFRIEVGRFDICQNGIFENESSEFSYEHSLAVWNTQEACYVAFPGSSLGENGHEFPNPSFEKIIEVYNWLLDQLNSDILYSLLEDCGISVEKIGLKNIIIKEDQVIVECSNPIVLFNKNINDSEALTDLQIFKNTVNRSFSKNMTYLIKYVEK